MSIRRPPQKRAFIGLVGRNIPGDVLVQAVEPPLDAQKEPTKVISEPAEPLKRKRGRPPKDATGAMSAAERMRAYREREAEERKAEDNRRALITAINEWPEWRGKYITGAPHGKGLLITGGYDPNKVEQVSAAHERAERREELDGPNVRPPGHVPDQEYVDIVEERDNAFVNKAFRKTYGLSVDEAKDYERQVLKGLAQKHSYCSFQFQCQVCHANVWAGDQLAHFKEHHPHLISEEQLNHSGMYENEILKQLTRKNFIMVVASFYCQLCDERGDIEDGCIEVSSFDDWGPKVWGGEHKVWDGDYITFVNLNRRKFIDHLYKKHPREVSREVREFVQRMTPDNWFKRMAREKQNNCPIDHEKLAKEKAAEWAAKILATDRDFKACGDWAAAERPATYPCPNCNKKLPLVIS